MKTTQLKLAAFGLLAAGLFAFNEAKWGPGSIRGTVSPQDAAVRAWAESHTDTIQGAIVNGAFQIPAVKPGTYRIIIGPNRHTGMWPKMVSSSWMTSRPMQA
jgi:hypothetical protein